MYLFVFRSQLPVLKWELFRSYLFMKWQNFNMKLFRKSLIFEHEMKKGQTDRCWHDVWDAVHVCVSCWFNIESDSWQLPLSICWRNEMKWDEMRWMRISFSFAINIYGVSQMSGRWSCMTVESIYWEYEWMSCCHFKLNDSTHI